jgi:LysM repeat protein
MIPRGPLAWLLMVLPLATLLSGCYPAGQTRWDEEKDPHYLAGSSRVGSLDYDGAIEAFEKALESNPRSAAAHLQLGLLYEEKKQNYARAIYHFEEHLELRPRSNYADMVKQHIITCKLELARNVSFAMVSQQVQDEIRKLNATNALLRGLVERLKTELVEQATAYSNQLMALTLAPLSGGSDQEEPPVQPRFSRSKTPPQNRVQPIRASQLPSRASPAPRIHFVTKGETLASISRRYGVSLSAIRAANPGVDPRRLRVGQAINVPGGR